MVNNSTNINKTNNHLWPQLIENKKDHVIWRISDSYKLFWVVYLLLNTYVYDWTRTFKRYDITEILLKVALNTIIPPQAVYNRLIIAYSINYTICIYQTPDIICEVYPI
jgi:hypothetical protein